MRHNPIFRTGATEFDASGMIVAPGFIDLHTPLADSLAKNGRKIPRRLPTLRFAVASPRSARCRTRTRRKTTRRWLGELMLRCASESAVRVTTDRRHHKGAQRRRIGADARVGRCWRRRFLRRRRPCDVSSPDASSVLLTRTDLDLPIINHAEDRGLVAEWDMNEGVVASPSRTARDSQPAPKR